MKRPNCMTRTAAFICALTITSGAQAQSLWDLANQNKDALRIATLFPAQDVRDRLSTDKGIDDAIDWCKKTGVTHAFTKETPPPTLSSVWLPTSELAAKTSPARPLAPSHQVTAPASVAVAVTLSHNMLLTT